MKLTKIAISILLVMTISIPAMASSDWVDDFLRRYDPAKNTATVASNSELNVAQFLRTGEVPISLNDVQSNSKMASGLPMSQPSVKECG